MSWAIKGLDGPLKDKIFEVKAGLTLGRASNSDILLEGGKVSSLHARISQSPDGEWRLEDNNSKNGIRVGGETIQSIPLSDGLIFQISNYVFQVIAVKTKQPPKKKYWYQILAEFIEAQIDSVRDRAQPVTTLNPALVLDFQRGPQVNLRWILGYGPRNVGPASLDLPIWEPGAPPICFEVFPSPDGLVFKTHHSDVVRVNGQSVDSHILCVGDTIQILETIIEVDFAQ